MTVVMLTTAGVTCLATSVKPFAGVVMTAAAGVEVGALDAWDALNE
jgi:hypothetical protein